jgi:MFS family permease
MILRSIDGLWRHPDFVKLWAGQTVSLFGSQVTLLALPLTAVLVLRASPIEMGLLGAAGYSPYLLVGLFAGVWTDRHKRHPIMIASDAGRAALLATIPLAGLMGLLRMEQLYAVAFLTGVFTVFFDVAYMAALPRLVPRELLIEANSRLEMSRSIAQIAGPGVAGSLVQIATAPVALLVDAASFLVSGTLIAVIRAREWVPAVRANSRTVWSEIGEGLRVVGQNPILRSIAANSAITNFSGSALLAVYLLYVSRDLRIEPSIIGLIFTIGGISGLLGAVLASRIAARFGVGPTLIGTGTLGAIGALVIPIAGSLPADAVVMLLAAEALISFILPIGNINLLSLRQAITPDDLQGRVNATARFLAAAGMPAGALVGGTLGEQIGLRPTLFAASFGILLGVAWLVFSPVRSLHDPRSALLA